MFSEQRATEHRDGDDLLTAGLVGLGYLYDYWTLNGQIDELAIYDLASLDAVALAAKGQEIASHYQVGNTAPSLECTNVLRDPTNGQLTLTWTSQPGKTYRLNSSTDLVDFTTVIADNIPSGGASTTYGPFAGPIPTGFFRV